MNILGKKIILRAIEASDLPQLQKWANDPAIQSLLVGWHFPVSERDQLAWFNALDLRSSNQRFAVDHPDHGLVGTANLVSIDWANGTATHGVMIGEAAHRGKGIALDAVMALMRHAFDELRLHRLDSEIIEYNAASQRFYIDKCGWKKEGVRPGWFFRKGRRWDSILIGIDRTLYAEHAANLGYWADEE
jgi:RimJ/RimL family protein N-acetyltransferase